MSSGPGITVPPPVIYLIALLMAIGLQRLTLLSRERSQPALRPSVA